MAYLLWAESREANPHLKADLRQAWIYVYYESLGQPAPFIQSSYACHGTHPERVFAKITAARKAKLGPEYSKWFDAAGNLRADAPKKPSASLDRKRKDGAA